MTAPLRSSEPNNRTGYIYLSPSTPRANALIRHCSNRSTATTEIYTALQGLPFAELLQVPLPLPQVPATRLSDRYSILLKLWLLSVGCDISQARDPITKSTICYNLRSVNQSHDWLTITAARISVLSSFCSVSVNQVNFVSRLRPSTKSPSSCPTHYQESDLYGGCSGDLRLPSPYSLELILFYNARSKIQCNTNDK